MPWWKTSVFYEIYLRSFQDSNGDGIGDLNGIRSRLGYLADLGVGAIWITPFYPSPQVDFGYDISDYENVDPSYGSLAEFDALVADAHRRGIRVVIDLVLNHTSDRHPFFRASRSSRTSPYRDWYIWRDGRDGPPNNWESSFGGPAWTFDPPTGQWYYHFFYREQPDLNWRNPDVEAWMLGVVKFWLARGVDGFRLDAINTLFEDPALRDNPPLPKPRVKLTGVSTQDYVFNRGLPEVHDVLKRLRREIDRLAPGTLLISEAYVDTLADLVRFYGEDDDEVQLPFNFFLAQVGWRDAAAFRAVVHDVERACGARWPSLVLSNHDIDRAGDRFAGGADPDAVAKLLATVLLTLRGTPFLYYGDEIAMRTDPPRRIEEVRDPAGRRFWPEYKGRDGVRRPMQWSPDGGFSSGSPWLPMSADAPERNVARQAADPSSPLNYVRALLRLRRERDALRRGDYRAVGAHPQVFAFLRRTRGDDALVVVNMSNGRWRVRLDDPAVGAKRWTAALGTHRAPGEAAPLDALELAPLEAVVLAPNP